MNVQSGPFAVFSRYSERMTNWPSVLPINGQQPVVPLALGTREVLIELAKREGLGEGEIKELIKGLAMYASSWPYLIACATDDARRHDLAGQAVDVVSDEHAMRSALLLHAKELSKAQKKGVVVPGKVQPKKEPSTAQQPAKAATLKLNKDVKAIRTPAPRPNVSVRRQPRR